MDHPRHVVARGPRAVEAHLAERVAALAPRDVGDLSLLAAPVRVVVPSGALRDHLAARLCRGGRAHAGVLVQTLDALAHEVLGRAGRPAPGGALLLDVLVRRASGSEPALEELLGDLDDGFAPLVGVVRDLLDAGHDETTREAFEDAVGALQASRARIERLRAILRVVARVRGAAAEAGHALPGDRFHAAAEALDAGDPDLLLPTRALLATGFSDVTGRAAELLEVLARRTPLELVLERPLDPLASNDPDREDRGARFTDRVALHLGLVLDSTPRVPPPESSGRRLARAPTREAEARAVAVAVRELLDSGTAPEDVAIAMRDPEPFRVALATHLRRLGVPFATGRVAGLADAATGRLGSLLALLERGPATRVDHWLDVERDGAATSDEALAGPELRLALRVLGLARLEDVCGLDLDARLGGRRSLALPLRRRVERAADDEGEPPAEEADAEERDDATADAPRSRRRVSAGRLRAARGRAQATAAILERWPARAEASAHAATLRRLVRERLGWRADERATRRLERGLARLRDEAAAEPLTREEFVRLLRRVLEPLSRGGLGGAGGGVRVLDVMEARGRAFEHLFLIGVERGLFPRAGSDDPLLPDALRLPLTDVLPSLPVKRRQRDEERFLFASLCSAARTVHVSHARADDDGGELLASPLFQRLAPGDDDELPMCPTALPSGLPDDGATPLTALELATLVGLAGWRVDAAARPAWLAATSEAGVAEQDRAALVAHRAAVLREVEGAGDARARPGPWSGLVGRCSAGSAWPDPWKESQPITSFERYASCGWQLFLERVLRLEPLPDPMAALPTIEPRQLGSAVHRALEAVALGGFPEEPADGAPPERAALADVLAKPGGPAAWPGSEEGLARLAREAARRELAESGVPLPGLEQGLARRTLPYLRAARALLDADAGEGVRTVLGAEARGTLRLELEDEAPLELHFVVDRVDRVQQGGAERLELLDYKTGRPWIKVKLPDKRQEHAENAVKSGRHLQGIAYARAVASDDGPAVAGRYVFLREDLPEFAATIDLRSDADGFDELTSLLESSVGTIAHGWREGVFLPRLFLAGKPERSDPNPACRHCEVAEACSLGDSAAAARLARWEQDAGADEKGLLRTARCVWDLGTKA